MAPHSKRAKQPKPTSLQLVKQADAWWFTPLLVLYSLTALTYLSWRTTVINWHIWYGPVLYGAEVYGICTTALFLFMSYRLYLPTFRKSSMTATVDVLIPTYSEPLDILEPVVIGATKIRGVRRVLVLDDGNRAEVAAMAERMNVGYYPRTDNTHAKAGNVNNGLAHTDAEFIIMLDADHVPMPFFVERTLGYFDDTKLAFVQSPQTFYNTTSFLFRRWRGRRDGWSEQMMFYNCIQTAKNCWNAAFFVGTSAMLRRSAVDSVGGFATGTATEDIHTSLRLHAKGWKSIYIPEALAYGLEADSFKEFYKQRKRWAAGSLGLLFRSPDSPLRARGLSVVQRLNYLSATIAHLQGVQRLCFLVVPMLTVLTGTAPLSGSLQNYTYLFTAYLLLALSCTWAFSRGTYSLLYNEMYALANMLAHFGGIKGIIKVQKKFAVSRKTRQRHERTWLLSVLWLLLGLAVASIGRDLWLYFADHKHNPVILYSLVFISVNATILLSFLLFLRRYEKTGAIASDYSQLHPGAMYSHITKELAYGLQRSIR